MTNPITYSIIATEFNKPLIDAMLEVALTEFKKLDLGVGRIIRVPGAYEVPLMADIELAKDSIGGVVVLGYIEKGETLHGEVMANAVSHSLLEAQIKFRKPIGIGIIGPGATYEQAKARYVGSAKAAVNALIQIRQLVDSDSSDGG